MSQKIRIKLKSYDHKLVDKSAEKIVKAVKATGAIVSGPIPLPTHKRIYTVNRSTFVNKKAREQFQLSDYKRLIDIYSSTAKTVDALMKLEGLIGRKIGMTSVFSADGKNVPCTVIEAGPCVVTQVKTVEKDGYKAVQLGFGEAKEKNTTKPMMGVFKKAGTTPKRHLAEFKFDEEYNLGDTITVDIFNDATFVDVVGMSKGKGFQGVMKRHGYNLILVKGSVAGCKGSTVLIEK